MYFSQVAHAFEEIESMSGRLAMTQKLADVFRGLSAQESRIISYFALGSLDAPYKSMQLNIAKRGVLEIISRLTQKPVSEIEIILQTDGDLGLVVQRLWQGADQLVTVEEVYAQLSAIVHVNGVGSTDAKLQGVVRLLEQLDAVSAKYVVRIISKTLRLGFSDMTVLDAISWMETGDKSIRLYLEQAYNICADLGLVVYTLKEDGLDAVKRMQPQVGIPIRPAAAERLPDAQAVIEKLGHCVAQPKLDGFRLQIHLDKTGPEPVISFYSRNLLDMSAMFPDVVHQISKLPVQNLICEGEAIGYDQATGVFLPFQETVKRKRKHGINQAIDDIPLHVYLFDVLYLNGKPLLDATHSQRRQELELLMNHVELDTLFVIEERVVDTAEELNNYFLKTIGAGLEGLVVKRLDAQYQAGKRNFNWIKLKRQTGQKLGDTIDAVVLGYYFGQGKRAGFGIGAFLVGVFNQAQDRFESVAKVGTGLTDIQWVSIKKLCDQSVADKQPDNVLVARDLQPDVWVYPEIVVIIRADDITQSPLHTAGKTEDNLGYALRFPRFIDYRVDKSPSEVTTTDELKQLYKNQFNV